MRGARIEGGGVIENPGGGVFPGAGGAERLGGCLQRIGEFFWGAE